LLDRQLALDLRLELELLGVVTLLAVARRDERPEAAGLVAVDPVDGLLLAAAVEAEDGREELAAEAASLELRRGGVHRGDHVLEVFIPDDQPFEAELVALRLHLGARLL